MAPPPGGVPRPEYYVQVQNALGYGDEAYFNALEKRLDAIVKAFDALPAPERANARARLDRIQARARHIGWGFGDAVDQVVHALDAPAKRGKVDGR